MSSLPPGRPEPMPSPSQPIPSRGRDRALSATPADGKKNALPPLPDLPPALPAAYEFGVAEQSSTANAPAFSLRYALPPAPRLVRNHLTTWFVVLAIVGAA